MVGRLAAFAVASAYATDLVDFDGESLSLLQHRALETGKPSPALLQFESGEEGFGGNFGHEVKERPLVDRNQCTESGFAIDCVDGTCICPLELLDNSLGARNEGSGVITGIRFYAAQAGNFALRIRNYRAIHGYRWVSETEEIPVPKAGVIQEYSFKKPLPYLYEDWIGFVHNGYGNIGYTEDQPGDTTVVWNGVQKFLEQQCFAFNQMADEFSTGHGKRTYSYSFITRPASKADFVDEPLCNGRIPEDMPDELPAVEPPFPDADVAAAVGDPHMTQTDGKKFDLNEENLQ